MAKAFCGIADDYSLEQDYKQAIEYYKKALLYKPDFTEALINTGLICEQTGDFENYERYMTEGFMKNPELAFMLFRAQNEKSLKTQIEIEKEKEAGKFTLKLEQMIQQYTHMLGNTLFPDKILQVAEDLKVKSDPELRKHALTLWNLYNNETLVLLQGELLELKHTGDTEKFRVYIRRSCFGHNANRDFTTLDELLNEVVMRVLNRLLNQGKFENIRQVLSEKHNITAHELRSSFEQEVFFTAEKTAIQWANEHISRISYTLSPLWQSLKLKTVEEAYAKAVLWGYFGELLFNALKYTDHTKEWVTITFSEEPHYLTSLWENSYIPSDKSESFYRGKGLSSIKNDLEMLNEKAEKEPKTLDITTDREKFRVKLCLAQDVFSYKSKIKRKKKEITI